MFFFGNPGRFYMLVRLQDGIDICQQFQKEFLIKTAGINTHLIVVQIFPFFIGKKFIVGLSGFIHFFHQSPGALLFPAQTFHNGLDETASSDC